MPETTLFTIKLDDEDRSLLDDCAQAERTTKAEVFRRALRLYAKQLADEVTSRADVAERLRTAGGE